MAEVREGCGSEQIFRSFSLVETTADFGWTFLKSRAGRFLSLSHHLLVAAPAFEMFIASGRTAMDLCTIQLTRISVRRCGLCATVVFPRPLRLLHKSLPNATIRPILSIRAFEFEMLHDLYLLTPDLTRRETNHAGHRLHGQGAFLQAAWI